MGYEYGLQPQMNGSELALPSSDKLEKKPLLGIRLNKLRDGQDFQLRPDKYNVKKGVFKYGGPASRSNGAEVRDKTPMISSSKASIGVSALKYQRASTSNVKLRVSDGNNFHSQREKVTIDKEFDEKYARINKVRANFAGGYINK